MKLRRLVLAASGLVPTVVILAQQTPAAPKCEDVYTDIKVFRGMPASDLIPAMEFMSASMRMNCTGCHKGQDYAAPTKGKEDARRMVLLQRDINEKWFNNRLEVTCMTCHNYKDHPNALPLPVGVGVNHHETSSNAEPEQLFNKHVAAAGTPPVMLTLTGTLTAPNDQTHKIETIPATLAQANDGRFRFQSGTRLFGSDGRQVWYYETILNDEPAATFGRFGRSWRGKAAFEGLSQPSLDGEEMVAKNKALVVRANRVATGSTEDLYFDTKSNLLVRLVNIKKSSLGYVVSSIDYSNFKKVGNLQVPMKVTAKFGSGDEWVMTFKTATTAATAKDSLFQVGGGD
jgi:hypothetical protein